MLDTIVIGKKNNFGLTKDSDLLVRAMARGKPRNIRMVSPRDRGFRRQASEPTVGRHGRPYRTRLSLPGFPLRAGTSSSPTRSAFLRAISDG